MKNDAVSIIEYAIKRSDPHDATAALLAGTDFGGAPLTVLSVGKAAIPMAKAAEEVLGDRIKTGLAVTKYGHTGDFSSDRFEIIEAAHPVSDEHSILAAERALAIADALTENDVCVILLSGGGSALLEKSTVAPEIQRDITQKLLSRGAEIDEINAVRRRLSLVKGGRLAAACYPAKVFTFALSDVLSNDKSVIASGISVEDVTDAEYIRRVAEKYLYDVDEEIKNRLYVTEKLKIDHGGYYFAGDINSLCEAAAEKAEQLGYEAVIVDRAMTGEARERAAEIIAKAENVTGRKAFVYGGETTVTLKGTGLGGRNQEMALAAAVALKGKKNRVFASAGSDGTDGPTDAAGGIADGDTYDMIAAAGKIPEEELENNDSYHALKSAGALIVTGPTGTNVNDLTLILCG